MNKKFDNLDAFKLFQELMAKQRTLLSGRITRSGGRAMIGWGLLLYRLIAAKAPTKSIVKILRSYGFSCFRIARGSGLGHLIKYLKTCAVLLQQYVAKNDAIFNSRQVGGVAVSCTRKGLPRIIPSQQRRLIRKGDKLTITFWLSLFNVYRYLDCPYGPNNYSTITDKGVGWVPDDQCRLYIDQFWKHLEAFNKKATKPTLPEGEPFLFSKVSVSVKEQEQLMGTSMPAVMRSAWNWRWLATRLSQPIRIEKGKVANVLKGTDRQRGKQLLDGFKVFLKRQPLLGPILYGTTFGGPEANKSLGPNLVQPKWYNFDKYRIPYVPPISEDRIKSPLFGELIYKPVFGRLVALREAAGKIRIIAIVDPFTQWLLKPLHKWLFKVLSGIPQDGTFNQEKPILSLMDLIRASKDRFVGSCDMSAATDRLPIDLQVAILSAKFGYEFGKAWKNLLVSRDYMTASRSFLKYSVGQPMGALSSWAMLAVTHHFLWQWASWRSGANPLFRWYKEYAVLGDDSAARNRRVVDEYLKICSELGVKVNLSKSLLSNGGCLEFAKRFMTPRGDCSPVSFGELLVSKVNFSVMSNWPRKRPIRLADLLYIMGYRHKTVASANKPLKNLPKRLKHMLIVLRSPWGAMPSASLSEWLLLSSFSKKSGATLDTFAICLELIYMFDRLEAKARKVISNNALPLFSIPMSGSNIAVQANFQIQFNLYQSKGAYRLPDGPSLMGGSPSHSVGDLFNVGGGTFKSMKQGSGVTPVEKLVDRVRSQDPNTARAVDSIVYDPARKRSYNEALEIQELIRDQKVNLFTRIFHVDIPEMEEIWKTYISLEERLYGLNQDARQQMVTKPFVMPSARSVVKIYNKFKHFVK